MKLTKGKLLETIRRKNEGYTTYQARKIAGISIRRVNQVWQLYRQTGRLPEIGKQAGRPAKPIQEWEISMVKAAYAKYRISASTLEPIIQRDHGKHIPHNRIHAILLQQGLAQRFKKVVRKKKWIRYERKHSLTAVHIDWHQRGEDGIWVFKVEDDASRALLAMVECDSPTVEKSIEGMKIAMQYGRIRQCISDHGTQFTSNNDGESRFKAFLDANGIQQILCRIKHPQSNGKVERLFWTYEHHRDSFPDQEAYRHWYNHIRPHRSLAFERLETPWQAFQRKMRTEG